MKSKQPEMPRVHINIQAPKGELARQLKDPHVKAALFNLAGTVDGELLRELLLDRKVDGGLVETAPDILRAAAQTIDDRAAARDQPEGERSMARTTGAFNIITGHTLSERDGWLFMVFLKAARACNTELGLADDYKDMTAYGALAGESVSGALAGGAE